MNKILLITNYSKNNFEVLKYTALNHLNYCAKWNMDHLFTVSKYDPHNNFDQLKNMLKIYQTVITIGSDVYLTNFHTDIRLFNIQNKQIVIQKQTENGMTNGDFIFWNRTEKMFDFLDELKTDDQNFWSTQANIFSKKDDERIFILSPSTIQCETPFEDRKEMFSFKWRLGKFSMHAMKIGFSLSVDQKLSIFENFLKIFEKPLEKYI